LKIPALFSRTVMVLALATLGEPARAQEPVPSPEPSPRQEDTRPFRLGGEFKANFRNSRDLSSPVFFPFPPELFPVGQSGVFMRTVDPGSSLELSNLALKGEGEITSGVTAKVEVHFLDLYYRNPTSSDDRILLREAWVRFGRSPAGFGSGGNSVYLLAGLAPRFSKQVQRRLESYGLWGTAIGRFEEPQIQLGGTLGRAYWRAMVGNGNPVFFRDTNALAGDNGTPERAPGNVNPIYQSGFPILYDAKPADLNLHGDFEWGGGAGYRLGSESAGADVLGWAFGRRLQETARIRGTFYGGDLKLLQGNGFPLPYSGDRKREYGVNVDGRLGGGRLFAQYVDQTIADLPRRGFEAELAWRFSLNGLFLIGESPAFNWIQPVVRVSRIHNGFDAPREYPGLSVAWDWTKIDLGLRVGIVREVDLTAEYSRHDAKTYVSTLHPDEALATLRVGF
jgi:hypothetical protein